MKVRFTEGWNAAIVGEVDADNCDELLNQLRAGPREGDTLIIDLAEMTFIDSSGISSLLQVKKDLESQNAGLRLTNPTDSVHRVFEITGLLETFGLSNSRVD